VAAWGRWLHWTGTLWKYDDTLKAFDLVRAVCREAAASCNNDKVAAAIASAKTVAAVERLAKSDRRLASTTDQWDSDPWLLNTPKGTVDLRTGRMRHHDQRDYITKTTAVGPGGECPIWLAFLTRVTGGDTALEAFLQRMLGYSLTGDTSAHALFFAHGHGANGKSVCIDTAAGILKDYHATTPIEAFTVSTTDRHPTDLARLRGARLVTAVETEEGRRWAESRVKALTGGDRIAARFMRQDFFEFTPQFKLLIAGNHKPGLRSVDEAIRRRFHLVPFAVTIPAAERDLRLSEKLRAEWPGILKWMIAGCLDWQRDGLQAQTPCPPGGSGPQYARATPGPRLGEGGPSGACGHFLLLESEYGGYRILRCVLKKRPKSRLPPRSFWFCQSHRCTLLRTKPSKNCLVRKAGVHQWPRLPFRTAKKSLMRSASGWPAARR